MKNMLNNIRLVFLLTLFASVTSLAQNTTDRDFSKDYLLETDLYVNHLRLLIDSDKNAGNISKGPASTSGNLQDLLDTAKSTAKQLRNNKNNVPNNIPVPVPPCNYKEVCGNNYIKGIVVQNSISSIQASIIDKDNNPIANLASYPVARNETHGLKVYEFNWSRRYYKGAVKILVTRTNASNEKETYEYQTVIQ